MKTFHCLRLFLFPYVLMMLGTVQACAAAQAPTTSSNATSIYEIPVKPMQSDTSASATLAPYRGKVLLIVNVASKCGFTPQYEGLERIYRKYKDRGLVVLGFPANDFLSQEPGTDEQIVKFCKFTYDVTFPIYSKIHVKGAEITPLYRYLTGPASSQPGVVRWNFEKFVIGRDGRIAARFRSAVKPESRELTEAIERALAGG